MEKHVSWRMLSLDGIIILISLLLTNPSFIGIVYGQSVALNITDLVPDATHDDVCICNCNCEPLIVVGDENDDFCEQKTDSCNKKIDLVIILDGSSSVGLANFQKVLAALGELVKTFNIDIANGMQVGFVVYSDRVSQALNLNQIQIPELLSIAIQMFNYPGGGTRTDLALKFAEDMFQTSARVDAYRIAWLITDGRSEEPTATQDNAQRLHLNQDVTVATFGITDQVRRSELIQIASEGDLAFFSNTFDEFIANLYTYVEEICQRLDTTKYTDQRVIDVEWINGLDVCIPLDPDIKYRYHGNGTTTAFPAATTTSGSGGVGGSTTTVSGGGGSAGVSVLEGPETTVSGSGGGGAGSGGIGGGGGGGGGGSGGGGSAGGSGGLPLEGPDNSLDGLGSGGIGSGGDGGTGSGSGGSGSGGSGSGGSGSGGAVTGGVVIEVPAPVPLPGAQTPTPAPIVTTGSGGGMPIPIPLPGTEASPPIATTGSVIEGIGAGGTGPGTKPIPIPPPVPLPGAQTPTPAPIVTTGSGGGFPIPIPFPATEAPPPIATTGSVIEGIGAGGAGQGTGGSASGSGNIPGPVALPVNPNLGPPSSTNPGTGENPGESSLVLSRSCLDLYDAGSRQSGMYAINPAGDSNQIKVQCDMETDGGGWTVIQRRVSSAQSFNTRWTRYVFGFGDINTSYWLGLRFIHQLVRDTAAGHELRIDLMDWDNNQAYAHYGYFSIDGPQNYYALRIGGLFTGTAGDSLQDHNGRPFSTYDQETDKDSLLNCAAENQGGWWYLQNVPPCFSSDLNGPYKNCTASDLPCDSSFSTGIIWKTWRGPYYSLKATRMMVRRLRPDASLIEVEVLREKP